MADYSLPLTGTGTGQTVTVEDHNAEVNRAIDAAVLIETNARIADVNAEESARQAAEALGDIIRLSGTAGTGDAITANIPADQAHIPMAVGQALWLAPPAANTVDSPSLTIDSVAYALKLRDGSPIPIGGLQSGRRYLCLVWATGIPVIRVMDVVAADQLLETAAVKLMTAAERTKLAGMTAGAQPNAVTSVAGRTGAVVLTQTDVGLGSVDNTPDADKPVSTPQQTALDGKAPTVHTHTAAQINDSTAAGRALLTAAGASAQRTALGLGAVENTSDMDKPVSTAQQAALDTKAPASHTHPASQINDSTPAGRTLLTAADAAAQRAALGLGTAAPMASSAFATAAQGAKADTALQVADLDAKADALRTDRADVVQAWRPGEDISLWSEATTAAPEDRDPIGVGAPVVNADGRALRITGADIDPLAGFIDLAPRAAFAVLEDRLYEVRFAVRRASDPLDPEGHGVELRLRNLAADKTPVSSVALAPALSPSVADGRQELVAWVCRGTPPAGVTVYAPPAGTRYATPFARVHGNGADTDLELISWEDVTDIFVEKATRAAADEAEAAARVAGDAASGAALAAHAALVNNPHSVTKAQVGLGNVDNTNDLAKPISTATQTALNLKADEVDLQAEVATRTLLITAVDGGGMVVTDEAGFVLFRLTPEGALSTALHDLGVDLSGGFVLKDPSGFVSLRVAATGEVSFGGQETLASRGGKGLTVTDEAGFVTLRVNALGQLSFGGAEHFSNSLAALAGMVITDEAGFVSLRVDNQGRISFGGDEYLTSDGTGGGLLIKDAAGFVGFRYDQNGLKVDGQTPTQMAVSSATEVELARDGVLVNSALELMEWRKGRGAVIQGTGETRILCIGDSNTATSGHETGTQRRRNSYPSALAKVLARHFNATSAGIYGSAGQGASYSIFDPRVTMGAGWSPLGAEVTLGGEVFANTTTTNALTFDPDMDWDVAEVTVVGLGAGDFTMDIGGAPTAFTAVDGAMVTRTFNAGSVGAHTLNINRTTGGVFVASWVFRNSQAPAVTVINGGRGGWKSSDILDTTNFYSPGSVLPNIPCSVVLLQIGINDHTAGVPPATYAANLQTIIDLCPANANVVLVSSVNPSEEGKPYAWSAYRAKMKELALLNGLPMIDLTLAMGDRSVIEANGWNADPVHPTFAGLAEVAMTCAKLLLN